MLDKDDFVFGLYFLLILLAALLLYAWVLGLIFGVTENSKEPCVEEYFNGVDTVYVDHNRFCHFEKEKGKGNYTCRNPYPTKQDRCILCGKAWYEHKKTQHTQQEIYDAFHELPLPY